MRPPVPVRLSKPPEPAVAVAVTLQPELEVSQLRYEPAVQEQAGVEQGLALGREQGLELELALAASVASELAHRPAVPAQAAGKPHRKYQGTHRSFGVARMD